MVILLAIGMGIGINIGSTAPKASPVSTVTETSTVTQSAQSSPNVPAPYAVMLVVTTGNGFNSSVGEQPAFFVLGPGGLQSAASISLPANRLIKLVIVNYDEGNLSVDPKYIGVSGTVSNSMLVVSNANVNSSQGSSGIVVTGGQNVTAANPTKIAHTFTIPSLGLNVPLTISSTTIVYFTVPQVGTYKWFCMTPCGSGRDGLHGAMGAIGWMIGTIVAA